MELTCNDQGFFLLYLMLQTMQASIMTREDVAKTNATQQHKPVKLAR
jgi:hypothetical protein